MWCVKRLVACVYGEDVRRLRLVLLSGSGAELLRLRGGIFWVAQGNAASVMYLLGVGVTCDRFTVENGSTIP